MGTVFTSWRHTAHQDIFARKLADQDAGQKRLQAKIDTMEEKHKAELAEHEKFKAMHELQMKKFEKLKKSNKSKAMDIWRRYQFEDLPRITLYRRAFGNWKWLMPVLRDANSGDIIKKERKRADDAEALVRKLNGEVASLCKERDDLKNSIIARGVQACVSHAIAVLRQRTFMKKSFTDILTKTHLNHKRTLELKNAKIRELEKDIEEDRTLQKLSRELEETKWMMDTLPGVPPRKVHLVDPTRACMSCKRQVVYQEYCAAAPTDIVTLREQPGIINFQGVEPRNFERNLFNANPDNTTNLPPSTVGVDGIPIEAVTGPGGPSGAGVARGITDGSVGAGTSGSKAGSKEEIDPINHGPFGWAVGGVAYPYGNNATGQKPETPAAMLKDYHEPGETDKEKKERERKEREQSKAPLFEIEAYRARVDRDEIMKFGSPSGKRMQTPSSRGRPGTGGSLGADGKGADGHGGKGGKSGDGSPGGLSSPSKEYLDRRVIDDSEFGAFGFSLPIVPDHLVPDEPPVVATHDDPNVRRTDIEEATGAPGTGTLPRAIGGDWSPLVRGDLTGKMGGQVVAEYALFPGTEPDNRNTSPSMRLKRAMNKNQAFLHGKNTYRMTAPQPGERRRDGMPNPDPFRGMTGVYPQAAPATKRQASPDSPFALGYSLADDWRNQRSFLSSSNVSGGGMGMGGSMGGTFVGGSMGGTTAKSSTTRYNATRTTMGATRTTGGRSPGTTVRSPTTISGGATTSLVRSGDTWALMTNNKTGTKQSQNVNAAVNKWSTNISRNDGNRTISGGATTASPNTRGSGPGGVGASPGAKTLTSFPSSGGASSGPIFGDGSSPKSAMKYPVYQGGGGGGAGGQVGFASGETRAFGYGGGDGGKSLPGMTKLWK